MDFISNFHIFHRIHARRQESNKILVLYVVLYRLHATNCAFGQSTDGIFRMGRCRFGLVCSDKLLVSRQEKGLCWNAWTLCWRYTNVGITLTCGTEGIFDDQGRGYHDACRYVFDFWICGHFWLYRVVTGSDLGNADGTQQSACSSSSTYFWRCNRKISTIPTK